MVEQDKRESDQDQSHADVSQSTHSLWQRCRRYGLVVLLLLAAVILASVSSLLSYRFHHKMGDLADDVVSLSQHIDQLQQTIDLQRQTLKRVQKMQHHLMAQAHPANWHIMRARYLVQLAEDRLQFDDELATPITLLTLAEQQLLRSGNTAILAIRQQLAQAITTLKGLPKMNRVTIYQQLAGVATLMSQLRSFPASHSTDHATSATNTKLVHSWRQGWRNSLKRIEKLVVIQHHDDTMTPLLTQQQYRQLNYALLLLVRQAQWALLYRQQTIYQNSLQQLAINIMRYYDKGGDHEKMEVVLKQIHQLQQVPIVFRPPPVITPIGVALTDYLDRQLQQREELATKEIPMLASKKVDRQQAQQQKEHSKKRSSSTSEVITL